VSPELTWSNVPARTKRFTLIVTDLDSNSQSGQHLWGLSNIPKGTTSLPEDSARFAVGGTKRTDTDDLGSKNYRGRCPATGELHRIRFEVYALKSKISPRTSATAAQLRSALRSALRRSVAAKGSLVAAYPSTCDHQTNCSLARCTNRGKSWRRNGAECLCS
jgi:Raf kinase inhibitor-like YbhB/YbcL family protein